MGKIAFLAEEAGATQVTEFDVGDADQTANGHEEWGSFTSNRDERGSKVRFVQGDLEDPEAVEKLGKHDIIFFSGVLYHTPNPMRQLINLREVTGELAFLSTLTIPEIPGFPQACIFYPYLSDRDRERYAAGYPIEAKGLLGVGTPFDDRPMHGYGNCWWGISRSALLNMIAAARFEVVEELPLNTEYQMQVVLRAVERDPLLPPVGYFRERGEARDRGEPRWAFDNWFEEQRKGAKPS